ncbi:MAG: hypothetical protein AB7S46_17595, partial [Flavobacteriaceae bacterium]
MIHADTHPAAAPRRGAGYWFILAVAILLILLGLVIGAGGAWLMSLGGSWYYLIAGIGLLLSGILLARPSMAGVWVYAITWLLTLVWALWEKGFDGWAQVPRLVAPTVIFILVLCLIPALRRREPGNRRGRAAPVAAGVAAALMAGGGVYATGHVRDAAALNDPAPVTLVQAQVPERPLERPGQTPDATTGPAVGDAETAEPATRREPMAMLQAGENWPAYGG